jgi:hypothetical protein
MPDNSDQKDDANKRIDPLNSLPVLEQSVWTKLLTAGLPAPPSVPHFDFPALGAALDVSNLAVAARMASEISTLTETARMIPDVSKLGEVVRLAAELSKVAQAAIVNPEFYKVAAYAMPDFSKIAQIDLADETEEAIEKLAMRGWSLPWHLSIGQARDLMDEDPEEIDAFFEAYFENGGLEAIREDILGDKKLEKWKVLLDQCFKNYSSGDFQICIPSLISVLEGSFDYLAFFDERRRKKFFEERIQAATSFQKLTWISLGRFCDVVFMSGDPRRATVYINRHKVMHGSDDPSGWKKVDCLRLFQALDSTRRLI